MGQTRARSITVRLNDLETDALNDLRGYQHRWTTTEIVAGALRDTLQQMLIVHPPALYTSPPLPEIAPLVDDEDVFDPEELAASIEREKLDLVADVPAISPELVNPTRPAPKKPRKKPAPKKPEWQPAAGGKQKRVTKPPSKKKGKVKS